MEKFKFRFSYFLILGLIGMIFQIVFIFAFKDYSITYSEIIYEKNTKYFQQLVLPITYQIVTSSIMMVAFSGYLFLKKKKDIKYQVLSLISIVSNVVIIISQSLYLNFTYKNRTDLFDTKFDLNPIIIYENIRSYALLTLVLCAFLFGIFYIIDKRTKKITRIGAILLSVSSLFFIVSFILVRCNNESYLLYSRYISPGSSLSNFFNRNIPSMNSYTYGQMSLIIDLFRRLEGQGSTYQNLHNGAILTTINFVSFYVLIICSVLFMSFHLISSFDVDKDDDPMSL